MPLFFLGMLSCIVGMVASILAGAAVDKKEWGTALTRALIALQFILFSCAIYLKM